MRKYLVEIYLPAANKTFDVFVPTQAKVSEVTVLAAQAIAELADGTYTPTNDTVLCERSTGKILNINKSMEELEISNGSKLILI